MVFFITKSRQNLENGKFKKWKIGKMEKWKNWKVGKLEAWKNGEWKNLTNGKTIYWKNVKKLIKFLADNEYDNLINEYKIRDKWEKRVYKSETVDDQKMRYLIKQRTSSRQLQKIQEKSLE